MTSNQPNGTSPNGGVVRNELEEINIQTNRVQDQVSFVNLRLNIFFQKKINEIVIIIK